MIRSEINSSQRRRLLDAMNAHEMTAQKRQKLLFRIAKYGVITAAKRHVKQQKTPDGQAWTRRKRSSKKPMLRNFPKLLKIKEIPSTGTVRVYLSGGNYRNGKKNVPAGVIAQSQQDGQTVNINKSSVVQDQPAQQGEATKKQAKKLRALNYQVRKKGRYVKASSKYITENLTRARAGLLIRILQNKPLKKTWSIDLPSREFLGLSDEEFNSALDRQLQGMNYG